MKKTFKSVYIALILLFLYAPIAVMIALSFNASKSRAVWGGFSLTWYAQLFDSLEIMQALQVTLTVAVLATLVATVIGSLGAIGIHAMKTGRANALINLSYLSMTTPDIATGVSLMLLFVMAQNFGIGGESGIFGWFTLLIAHITFTLPYVILSVLPKIRQMDHSQTEAALDLGCRPLQAFFKPPARATSSREPPADRCRTHGCTAYAPPACRSSSGSDRSRGCRAAAGSGPRFSPG